MYLKNITLCNFKNYEEIELNFNPKINCIVGNNGSGKTNLLDAIHYLSFSKSFLNSYDSLNIRHNQDFFAIHGHYSHDENTFSVSCVQNRNSHKVFKYNKKEYPKISEHIGKIPLIIISPSDHELIQSGSEIRRKFLDSIISQSDKEYLDNLIRYNKSLEQRNKLLKQDFIDASLLEVFNMQLCKYAEPIHNKRKEFISKINPIFKKYYNFISCNKEEDCLYDANIAYTSDLDNDSMDNLLKLSVEKEKYLQYTTVGVHKDELKFLFSENLLIKKFGSQGQQKSFLIALKLAQLEYIKNIRNINPILLLDDIFDKLDKSRALKLIEFLGSHEGQIFLSDTDYERIKHIFDIYKFEHSIIVIEEL